MLFVIWGIATVICTIAGPFGADAALSRMARFAYWAGVTGLCVGGSVLVSHWASGRAPTASLALWLCFTLVLSCMVWAQNFFLFDGWDSLALFGSLILNVAIVVVAVQALFALVKYTRPDTVEPEADPQSRFLRRLPLAERGPLVRIEAQDHYLKVVTDKAAPLILMRLGEAVDALEGAAGLQVHRSRWVALDAVRSHRRKKRARPVVDGDGTEVPVSRRYRPAAKAAGLF
ncbi:Transcriptional regulator, LytR/AlgR family [Sulfitobacter noctilucae]|uniref:LytTR family DNA-binding domain-containing protein n=1 Tax=Sulfitobacter noctilucae TaxID=1342302 RepID=UPI0012698477|nr:LytTR family DNA-binding domain-containing protein [Sulfitobacter noctilucae]KIN60259.1 Transcriptional regulator, LytR/AlgR family [Sulfitobacter noctilucae]